MKRFVLAFLLAAIVLTPLDALQVHGGILTAGPQPLLAPVRFGLLGVGLTLVARAIDPMPHPRGRVGVLLDALLFVSAYLATVLLSESSAKTAAVLGAIVVIGWLRTRHHRIPTAEILPFVALLGIGGPLLEISGVVLGLFRYLRFDWLGVPAWLPLLWMSGSFLVRDLLAGKRKESQFGPLH